MSDRQLLRQPARALNEYGPCENSPCICRQLVSHLHTYYLYVCCIVRTFQRHDSKENEKGARKSHLSPFHNRKLQIIHERRDTPDQTTLISLSSYAMMILRLNLPHRCTGHGIRHQPGQASSILTVFALVEPCSGSSQSLSRVCEEVK